MTPVSATVIKIGPYENNPSLLGKTLDVDRIEIFKVYNSIVTRAHLKFNGHVVNFTMDEVEFNVSKEELISITTCLVFPKI